MSYGLDNKTATKLVVGIFNRPGQEAPDPMHRWFKPDGGADKDPTIAAEIAAFTKEHGVKQCIMADRIMGCPHEEGVDYPVGGTCPHCPFWQDIDRFTHEPKTVVAPAMSVEQVLADLSVERDTQPVAALAAADQHREALIEPLLKAIERGVEHPTDLPAGEAMLFSYATYLLAQWREPRAHPLMIRWFSLPGEQPFDIGGDTVTQHGSRFLAMTCGGKLDSIKALILNREANDYCRGQAVEALAWLAAWGELPREEVEAYFLWLAREGLERECNNVWSQLAAIGADLEALTAFPELRRAYDEGLIEDMFIRPSEFDEIEHEPRGLRISQFKERCPPLTDVAEETAWWQCFCADFASDGPQMAEPAAVPEPTVPEPYVPEPPRQPYVAPPKAGRNDPCPCGSGKKFKKCCGR